MNPPHGQPPHMQQFRGPPPLGAPPLMGAPLMNPQPHMQQFQGDLQGQYLGSRPTGTPHMGAVQHMGPTPPNGQPPSIQQLQGAPPRAAVPPMTAPPMGLSALPPPLTPIQHALPPPPAPLQPIAASESQMYSAPPQILSSSRPGVWLYIGGIDASVKDSFMEGVLELVGGLKQWKCALNPLTNKSLGFGFAEFESDLDAARAEHMLDGLKLKEDGKALVAKLDNRARKSGLSLSEAAECESISDKVKFFLQNFSSSLVESKVAIRKKEVGEREENAEAKETDEGTNGQESKKDEETKKAEEMKDAEEDEAPDLITQEANKKLVNLEDRPHDVPMEIWVDIVEFRKMQVKQEIENDRERERILLRELKKLEEARENRERLEKEKEKAKLVEKTVVKTDPETKKSEKVDHTLKEDSLGSLNMTFDIKKTKKTIISNEEADEDEMNKRRKLVPLEYTEEERAAGRTVKERLADVAAKISESTKQQPSKEAKLLEKIRELVVKYVGEADESLVNFVAEKISEDMSPEDLTENLKDVLDEDAVEFVQVLAEFVQSL